MNNISEEKIKLIEWIGDGDVGVVTNLSDNQARTILSWCFINNISIENNADIERITKIIRSIDEFGEINYRGRTYILTEQAYQSNRLLNEYPQYLTYQGSGKSYYDEWEASAIDEEGKDCKVRWHFLIDRDEMNHDDDAYFSITEPDMYDWDDVYDVYYL